MAILLSILSRNQIRRKHLKLINVDDEVAMDPISFDRLTRLLSTSPSRRTLGGVFIGLSATLSGLLGPEEAGAHNPVPACRSIPDEQHRQRCLRRARRHLRRNHCPSGRANCDGKQSNRCETNIQNNVNHCGGCGIACTGPERTTVSCRNGRCTFEMVVEDGGVGGFDTPEAGTVTIEVLGGAGGRGGRGGSAFIGTGDGGAGGDGGGGGKVTATLPVAAGESFSFIAGRAGEDGRDANGGNAGAGGDTGFAGSDGDDGVAGTGGSGGGGGGGCGGGDARVRRNDRLIIVAGGGGGGGGGGGAGLGGTGEVTPGGAGGDGGNGAGTDVNGDGGNAGAGGVPGSGSGRQGGAGSPGRVSVTEISGTIVPGANPGPARIKATFIAARPKR